MTTEKQQAKFTLISILVGLSLAIGGIMLQLKSLKFAWDVLGGESIDFSTLYWTGASILSIGFVLSIAGFAILIIEYILFRIRHQQAINPKVQPTIETLLEK